MDPTEYIDSYCDLEVHKLMLQDSVRNNAYKQAIQDNAAKIQGKTVLDVGAGSGILSVYCAQAGAAKVYAVEASEIYKLAIEIVKENGYENVIEVIHGKIEDISLPGDNSVDVIVSEWMGFYLLHEGMLDSVIYARNKFLKANGLIFPESATLYSVPCSLPNMFEQWNNVDGVSMKAFGSQLRTTAARKPEIATVDCNNVISVSEVVLWIDLREITTSDLDNIRIQHVQVSNQAANYQGICLWFTCTFPSTLEEPVILSTDPDDPTTHWKQTVIVLPGSVQVEENEPIAYEIALTRDAVSSRRYNIEVEMLDPDLVAHADYCTCYMTKCILRRAMLQNYQNEAMEK